MNKTDKQEELYLPNSDSTLKTVWDRKGIGHVTGFFLGICVLVFALSFVWFEKHPIPSEAASISIYRCPITQPLLYDYPLFYQLVNRFIDQEGYEGLKSEVGLSQKGALLKKYLETAKTWNGASPLLEKGGLDALEMGWQEAPKFEKIKQGEIWRLITPAFIHTELLHLLFNMLWLLAIGSQVEHRLNKGRYLLLTVLIALFSNTAQYLMSGPSFIGYSGIICGLVAFIWTRKVKAPWEGYRLDRPTFVFMLVFVFGMASLDLVAFLLEKFYNYSLPFNLANTAHISGGLAGWLLASTPFFDWRKA